jgi:hypothetical protein
MGYGKERVMKKLDEIDIDAPVMRTTPPYHTPDANTVSQSQLTGFISYCERREAITFADFAAFHEFSVVHFRQFWRLFLDWSAIRYDGEAEPVCIGNSCEKAQFFPNLRLNYADILLSNSNRVDRRHHCLSCWRQM